MNNYYFTFGLGTPMGNKFQVIVAPNMDKARELMIAAYGDKWSMCYTEEQFEMHKQDGYFKNLTALPIIKQEVA